MTIDFYKMQPGDKARFIGPQWSPGPHFRHNHWSFHLAQAISMAAREGARTGRSINGARQYMGPRLFPPVRRSIPVSRKMAEFLALTGALSALGDL